MVENSYKKVVVVLLHKKFNLYLLQLRDFKTSIIYPGHWGAFGGALEEGESPEVAVHRELIEEIGYSPKTVNFFREEHRTQGRIKLNIYVFYAKIDAPLSELRLMEGTDMGMFTKEEILTKSLYSSKMEESFSIVPLLSELFDDFFDYIDKNIKVL
jgi:8-oxo-dGTP diphosphatase